MSLLSRPVALYVNTGQKAKVFTSLLTLRFRSFNFPLPPSSVNLPRFSSTREHPNGRSPTPTPPTHSMLALDEVVGLKAEIITANDDVYIGRIHSHNPRGTVTLIQTVSPPTKSVDNDRSQSSTATQQINFVAINVDYVKSIRALDRTKPRWKSSVNERFSKFIGAPTRIPTETLGERIRKGSPAIKEQEFEFKFRKLTRNISSEGKIILRRLIKELELPLEDIQIDLKNNIVFSKLSIKMFKPYKSTDVRIVASPDSAVSSSSDTDVKAETPVDPTKQKETITAMEKSIDASWKKIEQTQKGG